LEQRAQTYRAERNKARASAGPLAVRPEPRIIAFPSLARTSPKTSGLGTVLGDASQARCDEIEPVQDRNVGRIRSWKLAAPKGVDASTRPASAPQSAQANIRRPRQAVSRARTPDVEVPSFLEAT